MPAYHLSARSDIATALVAGLPVSDRLHAVAEAHGYVIDEGGIQVYGDGSVVIDCDRDPSEDWAAFDPLAARSAAEIEEEARREIRRQARRALTTLDADIARLEDTGQGLTIAQARPILLRLARIERGIILALVSLGLLEEDE